MLSQDAKIPLMYGTIVSQEGRVQKKAVVDWPIMRCDWRMIVSSICQHCLFSMPSQAFLLFHWPIATLLRKTLPWSTCQRLHALSKAAFPLFSLVSSLRSGHPPLIPPQPYLLPSDLFVPFSFLKPSVCLSFTINIVISFIPSSPFALFSFSSFTFPIFVDHHGVI